jgi:hypothetical protein
MQPAVACQLRTVRTNAADQNAQVERSLRPKRKSPKDRWKVLTTYNVLSFDQPLIDFFCLRCEQGSGKNIRRSSCLSAHTGRVMEYGVQ